MSKVLIIGAGGVESVAAHYTMVKNTTFNGAGLPAIAIRDAVGQIRIARQFGDGDYRNRLS